MASPASVRKVSAASLFVSEPNPTLFGNPKNERKASWTNGNWLKSRFHFSFAEYRNPYNANFGVLRVMNDDLVQPKRGFGMHGHSNMEIVTYIVSGNLTHKDSMGTAETLGRHSVQYMTAGSGVMHSEHNHAEDEALRFIQMWIVPRARGLKPEYGSLPGRAPQRDRWTPLVTDSDSAEPEAPIRIHADARISVAVVDTSVPLELAAGRQAYLLLAEGGATLAPGNGPLVCTAADARLRQHDAAELRGPLSLRVAADDATTGAHVLLVEMADDGSSRFDMSSDSD